MLTPNTNSTAKPVLSGTVFRGHPVLNGPKVPNLFLLVTFLKRSPLLSVTLLLTLNLVYQVYDLGKH